MKLPKKILAMTVIWFGVFFMGKSIDLFTTLPWNISPLFPLFMFWGGMLYQFVSQKIDMGSL
jgi:hypothetical protein